MLAEVYNQLQRLRGAGYGIWYALHTKFKNVKKDGDSEGYDKIGSLMTEDLYKNLAQDCDFICMISSEKNIQNGKLVGLDRKIRFTSDGFYDCGSRFSKYLPEKIDYDTFAFLDSFDEAIMRAGNFTREELEKQRIEQSKQKEKDIEFFVEGDKVNKEVREKEELVSDFEDIMPLISDDGRKALANKYKEEGVTNIGALIDKLGVEKCRVIHSKLKSTIN